jgi:hypothetical protein
MNNTSQFQRHLEELADNLFFLVGCGRSGTTLLQAILSSSKDIAIPPEIHFFRHVWMRRHEFGDLVKEQNLRKLLSHLFGLRYFHDLELSTEVIENKMILTERSVRSLFLVLLDTYREKLNKVRVGEKTPPNIHYVPTILKMFPQARIVNVVRDPRDVVNSLRKVPWSTPSVYGNVRRWKKYVQLHLEYCSSLPQTSYISLRYEDLVTHPSKEVKRLCNFLDVKYSDSMLAFYKRNEAGYANREFWKQNTNNPINRSGIGKGMRELKQSDIMLIERMTHREMILLGYQPIYEKTILAALPMLWSISEHLSYQIRLASKVLLNYGPRALLRSRPGK